MEQVGLDAPHEAVWAGTSGEEINWHLKPFFQEELEVHEAGEGGGGDEFHKEVKILGVGFPTGSRAKEPQFCDPGGPKFAFQ
jgi:ligand-binding SRPBCC domain-containing protein